MNHWRPNCDTEIARRRAGLLARARGYFEKRNVLAVDTPALGRSTVTDPQIDSVRTVDGLYLQTSPEFFMKRLLAAGYPDIYSICRVFRGLESGRLHLPEFTLIEWYRHAMGLRDIVEDTTSLIAAVLDRPDLAGNVERRDYADAFVEAVGLDPLRATASELAKASAADERLQDELGDRRDAWLDLLLATRVTPRFANDRLTVLQHYPASQAALARLCPRDPRVADRFEVFFGTLELANGYVELADAAEQARRMDTDLRIREQLGKDRILPDKQLLAALNAGIGNCAGVAVGFERLHMLAERADDLRDVVTFSEYPA